MVLVESPPALTITEACRRYNEQLKREKKPLCTACISACPYKYKPIYRDIISGEIKVCRHCPPSEAACLAACRDAGRGAMDLRDDTIVITDRSICQNCSEKPCIRACVFRALPTTDGLPSKCDLCLIYQEKTGSWGAPPRCAEVCPIKSIKYEPPRVLLWLQLAGVEIIPAPPPNAEHVEDRLGRRVSIYKVPGEAHYLYWFNLPRLPTRGKNLSEFTEVLLDNKMAAMIRHICNIADRIVDVSHLRQIKYITEAAYKAVEDELKRGVIDILPTADGLKYFNHDSPQVVIRYGRDAKGQLVLRIKEKDKDVVEIPFTILLQSAIADIVECLTHGPGVLKRLLEDDLLEEIEINGVSSGDESIPIWVFDKKYMHMKTNLIPRSLPKMIELANKLVSYAAEGLKLDPTHQIIDATLPGGERINVIGPERAARGISITIRKFTVNDVSPLWFCRPKGNLPPTISIEAMALLWQALEAGTHFVVGGSTASGKTTLLNVTSQFVPPSDRVLIVQDVAEIVPWSPNSVNLLMGRLSEGQTREDAMGELITASVTGDTYIILGNDNHIKIEQIGNVIDPLYTPSVRDGEPLPVNNLIVPAVDKDGKMRWKRVSYVFRHKWTGNVLDISIKGGRKVTVTPNHSVFTLKNGEVTSVPAGTLKVGDFIVCPRKIPCIENNKPINVVRTLADVRDSKTLFVADVPQNFFHKYEKKIKEYKSFASWMRNKILPLYLAKDIFSDSELRGKYVIAASNRGHNKEQTPAILDITPNLFRILGAYTARGSIEYKKQTPAGIIFFFDEGEMSTVKQIVKDIESTFKVKPSIHKKGKLVSVRCYSKVIALLFKEALKVAECAENKRVPPLVFNASEAHQQEYLKTYLSCSSGVSVPQGLINDLLYLLTINGIVAGVLSRKARTTIKGKNVKSPEIMKLRGSTGSGSIDKLNLNYAKDIPTAHIYNILKYPFRILKSCGKSKSKHSRIEKERFIQFFKRYVLSLEKLKQGLQVEKNELAVLRKYGFVENNNKVTASGLRFVKNIRMIEKLYDSDLCFLEISKIKARKYNGYVYDVSVEDGTESFVGGFGGVLLHNSLRMRPDRVIFGELRGSLSGKERVMIQNEGHVKILPFEQAENIPVEKMLVPTLDMDTYKIRWVHPTRVIKHAPSRNILEITTKTGRTVCVTGDHSLFILDRKLRVVPVEARNLKVGDSIIVPHKIPTVDKPITRIDLLDIDNLRVNDVHGAIGKIIAKIPREDIELLGIPPNKIYDYSRKRMRLTTAQVRKLIDYCTLKNIDTSWANNITVGGRKRQLSRFLQLDKQFSKFLGLIVSEGYIGKYGVELTNTREDIIEHIRKVCDTYNFKYSVSRGERIGSKQKTWRIRISSTCLSNILKHLGAGGKAHHKRIPPIIFSTTKENISAFLSGFIDGDGTVRGDTCRIYSSSEGLIDDLQYLLLYLGIIGYKKTHHGKTKGSRLVKNVPRGGNYYELCVYQPKMFCKYPHDLRTITKGRATKYYMERNIRRLTDDDSIIRVAEGEFFVDKIVKINTRHNTEFVYDFEVPGSQNFIGGSGGIICHNSEARSLRGCEEVLIINDGLPERVLIQGLENVDLSKIYAPTIDENYRASVEKVVDFVKHAPSKEFVKIITKTGREVTVTPFHSLFTIRDFKLETVKAGDLKKGDKIVIPSKVPCGYNNIAELDLLRMFENEPHVRVILDEKTLGALKNSFKTKDVSKMFNITKRSACGWLNGKTAVPIKKFIYLTEKAKIKYDTHDLKIRLGSASTTCRAAIDIDESFCRFLGYYLAKGNITKRGYVQITNDDNILRDVETISKRLGFTYHNNNKHAMRSTIYSTLLSKLLLKLGCGRTEKDKRVPPIIYGLSEDKIRAFLSGAHAGDICKNFEYYTTSKKVAEDIVYLLLALGIVGAIKKKRKGHFEKKSIYCVTFWNSTKTRAENPEIQRFGDTYLDPVVKVRKITLKYPEPSFDLSVNPVQRFIGGFGGILLHNTYFGPLLYGGGAAKGSSTTIHIDTVENLVERVRFKPMEVPAVHLLKLDFIMEARRIEDPFTKRIFRCITRLSELDEKLTKEGEIRTYDIWKYYEEKRDFLPIPNVKSRLCRDIMSRVGMTKEQFLNMLREKCMLLYYLYNKKVDTGTEFMRYMSKYYAPAPEGQISEERKQLIKEAEENVSPQIKERIDKILKIVATQLP